MGILIGDTAASNGCGVAQQRRRRQQQRQRAQRGLRQCRCGAWQCSAAKQCLVRQRGRRSVRETRQPCPVPAARRDYERLRQWTSCGCSAEEIGGRPERGRIQSQQAAEPVQLVDSAGSGGAAGGIAGAACCSKAEQPAAMEAHGCAHQRRHVQVVKAGRRARRHSAIRCRRMLGSDRPPMENSDHLAWVLYSSVVGLALQASKRGSAEVVNFRSLQCCAAA